MIFALFTTFFIFGTIIGSFLNVVTLRFSTKSFGGRSACMSCQSELSWYDLVPIVSFCMLSGRCRDCKTRISLQYPLVEIITGFIFAGLFLKFQSAFFASTLNFTVSYVYYAAMFSLLVVIAVYDIRHKIIPDTMSLVFGLLAFVGIFFFTPPLVSGPFADTLALHVPSAMQLLSGLVLALPFALMWLLSRGTWMGLGDAKLAIGLGFLLGFERLLSGAVIAFWAGAIAGVALILLSKKHNMKSEIPFAPFLVLGSVAAFLFELHFFQFGM